MRDSSKFHSNCGSILLVCNNAETELIVLLAEHFCQDENTALLIDVIQELPHNKKIEFFKAVEKARGLDGEQCKEARILLDELNSVRNKVAHWAAFYDPTNGYALQRRSSRKPEVLRPTDELYERVSSDYGKICSLIRTLRAVMNPEINKIDPEQEFL